MVLSRQGEGGARRAALSRLRGQRGSQTLELALAIPVVVTLLTLLLHAALLGADLVAAQAVALQAARVAAVDDDEAVRSAARAAAGRRPVAVVLHPPTGVRVPGEPVTAVVRLGTRAFAAFGVTVELPGRATLLVEDR